MMILFGNSSQQEKIEHSSISKSFSHFYFAAYLIHLELFYTLDLKIGQSETINLFSFTFFDVNANHRGKKNYNQKIFYVYN